MKKEFLNVEHTKPALIFIFILFLCFIFFTIITFLMLFLSKLFSIIFSLFIVVIFYFLFKKKLVLKSNFILFDDKLKINNSIISFNEIKSFKIHFIKGAGLKLSLKNGKSIYYSSNDNFCNSDRFINFCKALRKKLIKFDGGVIINKKSFMQTKIAYYFLIFITISIFGIFIHSLTTGKELKIGTFGLMIASLSTLWASIKTNN